MIYRSPWLKNAVIFIRQNQRKYEIYVLIILIIFIALSTIGIANGYLHFIGQNIDLKHISFGIFEPVYRLGYTGMFIIVAFFPLPDYIVVPFYGYLAVAGLFNIYITLLVSVSSMIFLSMVEYLGGRYAGRALLLKGLAVFRIHEEDLKLADRWIEKHGTFSIFISTFIPYIKIVISVAGGTLKMDIKNFTLSIFAGFFVRFAILLYIGYGSFKILSYMFEGKFFIYFVIVDVISALFFSLLLMQRFMGHRKTLPVK